MGKGRGGRRIHNHFVLCFFPFLDKNAINAIVFLFDSNPLSFHLPRAPKSQQVMVVGYSTLLATTTNMLYDPM